MDDKKTQRKFSNKIVQPTILEAIEHTVMAARNSELDFSEMKEAENDINYLAQVYGITPLQAVLFCVCMQKGPRRVDFDDLASFLDIGSIRMLTYASEIDALVRRRLLKYRDAKDEDTFDIPSRVIKDMKHNKAYEIPNQKGIGCTDLFEVLQLWFEDLSNEATDPDSLYEEITTLFNDNPQLNFVQKVKELQLEPDDFLLLILFCHLLVNEDDNDIRFSQIENICENRMQFCRVKTQMRSGTHELMERHLIEHLCEDGIAETTRFKLTDQAKRDLLSELNIINSDEKIAELIQPETLTAKSLYFSDALTKQVNELTNLLQPEQFMQIRNRMKEKGFRSGFACLFYGGPGTGKTETAYQLARQTGRSIMVVDVPEIKSKWVGDSEKNIKAIFDRYRNLTNRLKLAPILLFNEADALIGIRKNGAESAVDKMENSIQNIILQEMETLDGIMIATTNLQQNFDNAFERRFLYKLKFERPDASVRCRIWQQMIPELAPKEAEVLAATYDFSGGQIENIARRHAIGYILHGDDAERLKTLTEYCAAERLEKTSRRPIGF